jgi:N-acetylneuraminate synthase
MSKINNKIFKNNGQPYFIAEIGVNYENNFERAKKIIKLAKIGGADAVKFQSYKAETIACKKSPYYWDLKKVPIKSQYDLFKKFDKFGEKEFIKLKEYCDKLNIDFLSTPFDLDAVDYLDKLVSIYKIASADITNYPLITKICKKNKPIIISTGASTEKEILSTVNLVKKINKKIKIILMHCVLSYPTQNHDASLNTINYLKKKFKNLTIGYSDHTIPDKGMIILTNAYLNGARVIEKHFTDKKSLKGNDHFHSLDVRDLKLFRTNIELILKTNGKIQITRKVLKCELKSRLNARRSVVASQNIFKGEKLSLNNLIMKRPGQGISPNRIYKIIGKVAKKNIKADTLLSTKDYK